ncbi:ATP/GTP-binding protein, partial [Kitasatospora sp. NPDC018058]
ERMNQIQITNAVCELLCDLGTQLVLVDDVHLEDRRRQVLSLTAEGRALLSRCADAAQGLDAELTADLDATQRDALVHALNLLGRRYLPH